MSLNDGSDMDPAATDHAITSRRSIRRFLPSPVPRATIAEIARAFGISENHLTKVVHFLGKRGFLANVRGRGGGLALATQAAGVSIADVVRQTEGEMMPAECFDANARHCAIAPVCRLRGVLSEAMQAFEQVLAQYTLEDLVRDRRSLQKVLFVPRADR